ncbi:hypothetical protein [Agrobacterium sp. NPDC089420]|uniref:hypothetical protein n=1 Tax=Agrobacterium sp. NPDC089420 TaxID=3363918 RepID=UPI00384B9957
MQKNFIFKIRMAMLIKQVMIENFVETDFKCTEKLPFLFANDRFYPRNRVSRALPIEIRIWRSEYTALTTDIAVIEERRGWS